MVRFWLASQLTSRDLVRKESHTAFIFHKQLFFPLAAYCFVNFLLPLTTCSRYSWVELPDDILPLKTRRINTAMILVPVCPTVDTMFPLVRTWCTTVFDALACIVGARRRHRLWSSWSIGSYWILGYRKFNFFFWIASSPVSSTGENLHYSENVLSEFNPRRINDYINDN